MRERFHQIIEYGLAMQWHPVPVSQRLRSHDDHCGVMRECGRAGATAVAWKIGPLRDLAVTSGSRAIAGDSVKISLVDVAAEIGRPFSAGTPEHTCIGA